MAESRLESIRQNRIEKLEKLRRRGINPYPPKFDKEVSIKQALNSLDKKVKTAGRIMAVREHGQLAFIDLQDSTGEIQLWLTAEDLNDKYQVLDLIDVGDFLGVIGEVVKTDTGQTSIKAAEFKILAKAIKPLPEKWHGLKDKEERYRKRYLDLVMNPEVREKFKKRAEIYKAIRGFLDERGFIEVQTPILQTQYGGANARPFITNIHAWDMKMYLRIAYELHLKRLLVGGFEKVYDLSSCFRNEGADKTHNPEFAMIEIQWAYKDYFDAMKLTEELWEAVAKKVLGTTKIKYQGTEIDLKTPWERLTMAEALEKHAGIEIDKLSDQDLKQLAEKHDIETNLSRGELIGELFEVLCEHKLIQPVHIIDHPKELAPLAKRHRDNPDLIERIEPFINGWEVANCYSELINPLVQRELLEEQEEKGRGGDDEAHPMDDDYINALEQGLPPNVGIGIGIDRMVMLMTDSPSIRDVILFPIMKPRKNG